MKVTNRQAYYDYEILEKYEAGIKLKGHEVKSIKQGRIKLEGSYVKIIKNEAFLINAHIPLYQYAVDPDYEPNRTRKLLLHKRQIINLKAQLQKKNLTIIPLSCYTSRGKVKLKIALAKGKKKWDKRRKIKEREMERKIKRADFRR
jgi:SsrA-binding protein